jgi:hypothetical protein
MVVRPVQSVPISTTVNRQFNNEVFKIVSYDKAYTQFAGHYPIQSVFRNRVSIESLQT